MFTRSLDSDLTRRQFVTTASMGVAGLALGTRAFAQAPPRQTPPNIVVLLADDLGYADVGCFDEAGLMRTPHLDNLAKQGMKSTRFYACPNCSPARATLLTGRVPTRTGLYSYVTDNSTMHLRKSEVTIAQRLKQQGYATCMLGKLHLNSGIVDPVHPDQPNPDDMGFDYYCVTKANAAPHNRNPNNFVRNGQAVGPLNGYACDLLTDEAIQWMDQHREQQAEKPFFLFMAYHEPHESGLQAPADLIEPYSGHDFGSENFNRRLPRHMGTVSLLDRSIGRLLAHLDEKGLTDNTLVVFVSDNGSRFAPRNAPMREGKSFVLEGGMRVPAIWRWPGKIAPNSTSDTVMALEDLLPTFCAAAGTTPPRDRVIDGQDVTAALRGQPYTRPAPRYSYFYRTNPSGSLHDGDWKIVAYFNRSNRPLPHSFNDNAMQYIRSAQPQRFELFNLRDDPGEKNNLADREPQRAREMAARFTAIHNAAVAEGPVWQ